MREGGKAEGCCEGNEDGALEETREECYGGVVCVGLGGLAVGGGFYVSVSSTIGGGSGRDEAEDLGYGLAGSASDPYVDGGGEHAGKTLEGVEEENGAEALGLFVCVLRGKRYRYLERQRSQSFRKLDG